MATRQAAIRRRESAVVLPGFPRILDHGRRVTLTERNNLAGVDVFETLETVKGSVGSQTCHEVDARCTGQTFLCRPDAGSPGKKDPYHC